MSEVLVTITRSARVPSDPARCVNWAYRTNMPKDQNFRCEQLRDETVHLSDRDAQSSGLGVSGGSILSFSCALFNVGLRHQYGHGVLKCAECKQASGMNSGAQTNDGSGGETR
jgi:hypothetical protein